MSGKPKVLGDQLGDCCINPAEKDTSWMGSWQVGSSFLWRTASRTYGVREKQVLGMRPGVLVWTNDSSFERTAGQRI